MKKIKTRIGILFILLTVFTMFASCLNDDDEPKDKQKTVTLYVSATTGECTGMTGTPHECMLIKEKGEKTWEPCEFNGIEGERIRVRTFGYEDHICQSTSRWIKL